MKRKGFTLIELLAVIIILGILMLIAIPSVTTYINNSRKNTYVSTIQEIIKGTVARVNNGDLDMYDTDTTYYVPAKAINLEGGRLQSPYGEIEDAYVVVTYDGESYDYYYVGKDKANMGIGEITQSDKISKDSIGEVGTIDKTVGIGGRSKVVVFDDDLIAGVSQSATSQGGSSGSSTSGTSSNFNCSNGTYEVYDNAGTTVYFDPVSSSPCSASNEGTGTCYKWSILSESGSTATILLNQSVGSSAWINSEDYGSTPPKTDKGPITLLKNLKNATSSWTRVPLLNYSYEMTTPDPDDDRYSDWNGYNGYESMCCINGTCTIKDGTTIATGLRARVITAEEVVELTNDAIDYDSATPSVSQTWTSATGGIVYENCGPGEYRTTCNYDNYYLWLSYRFNYYDSTNYRIGIQFEGSTNNRYYGTNNKKLEWLSEAISYNDAHTLTSGEIYTYTDNNVTEEEYNYRTVTHYCLSESIVYTKSYNSYSTSGMYPVITIEKSLLTY